MADSLPPSCPSNPLIDFPSATTPYPPPFYKFLQTYSTLLHSSSLSFGLRVFWSPESYDPIIGPIQDKIRYAFQNLDITCPDGVIQFWAPVRTGDRQLLTTSNQPFGLGTGLWSLEGFVQNYRLCSLKYQYNVDVNNLQVVEDDPMIISGPPATAFRNQLPELRMGLRSHETSPLESLAFKYGFTHSVMIPVFYPSQRHCVGVIECSMSSRTELLTVFNKLNTGLKKHGLKPFDSRQRLPYKTICDLQNAKNEIDGALKIILKRHGFNFAQVWIACEDGNHVTFTSSLEDIQTKPMIGLKLTGHCFISDDKDFKWLEDYGNACYNLPLKMDEGKTLENHEPYFINNKWPSGGNTPKRFHLIGCGYSCFVIYLRNTKTGDLDYVFEFLRSYEDGNSVKLLESLLLSLKRYLPRFKFGSGTKLGDEITHILDLKNSTESEHKYIKIFQTNKISLKRGRQPNVEESLTPLKAKGKTTPIILSREQIESQFGQTQEEAAPKLRGNHNLFASDTELGDEIIEFPDLQNSIESEHKYIKIFQTNQISLKRGRQPNVEEPLTSLKAKGKTTPIILSQEQIESQFGQTQKEAAPKLNASVSTLKRNCIRLGIKWQGIDNLKRNVKHSYKNQSNTNEEEDQGGAIQDPSSAIIQETPLDENILTIKAEYAGDVIKFTLPISSATFEAIQKKIVKKFNLDPTVHYKLKYLDDEDNEWILFNCDEDVTLCTKNKRSVRLRLLQ